MDSACARAGGRHAATTWTDGAFLHFALYQSTGGTATSGVQVAFRVADLEGAHKRALEAGADRAWTEVAAVG